MARKAHNIHYVYKTTCSVTGKYYVGMHSTSNENDGYMGSGKRLRYSIRKHGAENHSREILEYCDTREALVLREIEIVNSELISNEICMNLKEGGNGGLSSEEHYLKFITAGANNISKSKDKRALILREKRKDIDWVKKHGENISKGLFDFYKNNENAFKDKTHSEETKQLISQRMKEKGIGETNSQYGTCWITKDGLNKKIKKEEIDTWTNEGWVKGRYTGF